MEICWVDVDFSDLLVALQEQKVHNSRDSSVWTTVLHAYTVAHYEWGELYLKKKKKKD